MDREQTRQEIRRNWRQLITGIADPAKTRVNGEASYICPLCGHGTHGDGLTVNPRSVDGNGLKCFGCNFSGDIIDLYQRNTGADYNTAFSALAGELGITVDRYNPAERPTSHDNGNRGADMQPAEETPQRGAQSATRADYTEYYKECRARLTDPAAVSYLSARGISLETAQAHNIGFDPAADPGNNPGGTGATLYPCPRIIAPTTKAHYIGRSIDPTTEPKYRKMNPNRNKGAGEVGVFNVNALYAQGVQEIFVVEGFFDALSIMEAGAEAIAINSTSNADALIKRLENKKTTATLIIALDNDTAGAAAIEKLEKGAQRLKIKYITGANICCGCKDPNEALQQKRAEFVAAVKRERQRVNKPDNTSYYIDALMTAEMAQFKSDISSGYANLDRKSGGIYAGLYCIAAISSLGKTTFTAQMADQIAAAGNDVLFFSLEQSRLEMVSKSLARRTAQADMKTAVTSLSIRKGYLPPQVLQAAEEYKAAVSDRISIIEGNFDCDISLIGGYIERYLAANPGKKPVVIIDYLQILQPETTQQGRQQTTKETVDTTVTTLKRISRDNGLPIFTISSVNRANYMTPIDFESLKESGSIEYTCDVIWGLQLQCLNDELFNGDKQGKIKEKREKIKEAKAANPRKIELVCLKNRYGAPGFNCGFDYFPANDLFVPQSEFEPATATRKAGVRL